MNKTKTQDGPVQTGPASLLASISKRLARTRKNIMGQVQSLIKRHPKVDREFLDELEAILLQADVGVKITQHLLTGLSETIKDNHRRQLVDGEDILEILKNQAMNILGEPEPLKKSDEGPTVIMVVGVNGTGKTTTVGKLCHRLQASGSEVILGATDTFRAAAIDQLKIWGERTNTRVIHHEEGGDPAAVAYDTCQAGKAKDVDYIILDTAGRLHTHVNLMKELEKVKRIVGREINGAPHEVLLVLDATLGQNGLSQAKKFWEVVEVTGIVLTKLDGTAKGGVVLAVRSSLGIPIKFLGIGENAEDLRTFDPREFVDAIFHNQGT